MFTIDFSGPDIFIRKYQMKVPLILLVLFGIFLALPATFRTTRDLLGPWVADSSGDPSGPGFFFHALVLTVLVLGFSKTVSTFILPSGEAGPVCYAPGPSPESRCLERLKFDASEVGKKCHVDGDPKGVALGWVQPDLVTCDYTPPPASFPPQINKK
jgi:hypothetical protein